MALWVGSGPLGSKYQDRPRSVRDLFDGRVGDGGDTVKDKEKREESDEKPENTDFL